MISTALPLSCRRLFHISSVIVMVDDGVQLMSSCTTVADVGVVLDVDGALKGGVPVVVCGVDDMVAYVGVVYDEGGG